MSDDGCGLADGAFGGGFGLRGLRERAAQLNGTVTLANWPAGGGALIEPSVARKVLAEFARLAEPARPAQEQLPEPLTEREVEILRLLAAGANNRQIASQLFLAEGTVKNYVSAILAKLGVEDRTQAALRARELGAVEAGVTRKLP